ncbi:MAG: serine hydrolase [Bacteroidetes bacterium]|nr:serine hydrolase [Bacteroidota bacterium]
MSSKLFHKIAIYTVGVLLFSACKPSALLIKERKIDAIFSAYNSDSKPGASVLVYQNDKIVFQKGYGVKELTNFEKIDPYTNFRLASVTKQFTAMSILLLAKNNKLSLEDPLTKYFSSFPAYGKKIKIKHLLTHSSGLVDYEDLMPVTQQKPLHDTNCLQLMYLTDSLYFQAGTDYRYSNTGYGILALIVEKISGQDFATFLKQNIFMPLGMKSTVAFEEGKSSVVNRAYGSSFENGVWTQTDQSLTSAVLGDGGIYTNTVEMTKWIKALWDYKLLSPEMQKTAWSRKKLDNGKIIDYGYGWHVEDYNNITHPHHGGSSIGFRNHILLFPEQKLMIIVLTNRNEGDPIIEAKKMAELYLN